jgi:hypothetical protein
MAIGQLVRTLQEASVRFPSILRPLAAFAAISPSLSCNAPRSAPAAAPAPHNDGLILQDSEGERRVRRNAGKGPFML